MNRGGGYTKVNMNRLQWSLRVLKKGMLVAENCSGEIM